jgi:hypothetical protein
LVVVAVVEVVPALTEDLVEVAVALGLAAVAAARVVPTVH